MYLKRRTVALTREAGTQTYSEGLGRERCILEPKNNTRGSCLKGDFLYSDIDLLNLD